MARLKLHGSEGKGASKNSGNSSQMKCEGTDSGMHMTTAREPGLERAKGARLTLVARQPPCVINANDVASMAIGPGTTVSHPVFKSKVNAHSMCAQESSLHTYHIENGYKITNVTIYSIYYHVFCHQKSKG
jgi:hypothetical protein